jgi:hypothetical protein
MRQALAWHRGKDDRKRGGADDTVTVMMETSATMKTMRRR